MLKILHKGIQISADLDPAKVNLDVEAFAIDTYIQGLKAGCAVTITASGVALADGAAASNKPFVGFLINDTAGYFYENKPALASGKVGVTFGNSVVVTDQIDTTETFAPGDLLYVGTSTEVGLITKTAPTGAVAIGVALSAASASSPELTIAVK